MKKMLIACFFAVLMLMVPFTAFGQTTNIPTVKNIENVGMDTPEFYLTKEQMKQVNAFINEMFEGEEKIIAENIRDYIIDTSTRRVDIVKLANALLEYTYQPIPQEELDLVQTKEQLAQLIELYWILDAFGAFVFFITSLVSNRLGWLYDLINDGYALVSEGVQITISILHESIDVVLDLVDAINLMLTIPQVFQDLMEKLFNKQYEQFKTAFWNFINNFIGDFVVLVLDLIDVFLYIPSVKNYLRDEVMPFLEWTLGAHWKDKIRVKGIVFKNFIPVSGATITVRGRTGTTDNMGVFDFDVPVEPSEDSFPPNEYIGAHNCQITVEKDGEVLQQTQGYLSYVFSGGIMNWPFIIIKGRSRTASLSTFISERLGMLLGRLHLLFPNFFRVIARC